MPKASHANVRFGSKADIAARLSDTRFTPKSGHWRAIVGCPLCVISGLMRCSKKHCYSITSSAIWWSCSGTSRPNALAVLRLMAS